MNPCGTRRAGGSLPCRVFLCATTNRTTGRPAQHAAARTENFRTALSRCVYRHKAVLTLGDSRKVNLSRREHLAETTPVALHAFIPITRKMKCTEIFPTAVTNRDLWLPTNRTSPRIILIVILCGQIGTL